MYNYNLGQYFNTISGNYAENPALKLDDRIISYGEFARQIEALAYVLCDKGIRRGDVIAIGHTKHPLSYALMHAALRLGVAYVILDVDSPVERASMILNVSRASLLFYDSPCYEGPMRELASTCRCSLQLLTEEGLPSISDDEREKQQYLMKQVDGSTIAYVMFTSGSTGIPKGVAVTHQNVLHFIAWGQKYFGITPHDNFANLSPMYFDNSVFDFYVGMFAGACLTPVLKKLLNNPYELVEHLERMKCTIWFSVPSLLMYLITMKAIAADSMPDLRTIVFGGEGYPKVELKKLYDRFAGRAQLVNVYGPTECTCICSAHTLDEDDFSDLSGLPSLGRLNPNFDYRIVDEAGHDALSGELCLIGPNVAAGYFNDIERTSASFHILTDANNFMKRMYRTGDLVRKSGGELYFIGRKDNQIKHMGYRIELEEIEYALAKLPAVDQAAVVYHRTNTAFGKLIGFVACSSSVEGKELVVKLGKVLPDYMVPSKIVVMDTLPKNPNGKIDRKQLRSLLE